MNSSWCRILVLNAVCILLSMNSYTCQAETPSPEEIASRLTQLQKTLFSQETLRLNYSRTASKDPIKTKYSGGLLLADWVVAGREGKDWYSSLQFKSPDKSADLVIPAAPVVHAVKSGMTLDWTSDFNQCVINPTDRPINMANVLQGWEYLLNCGFNPYSEIFESQGIVFDTILLDEANAGLKWSLDAPLLPDFLNKNIKNYSVRPEREEIDGSSCVVLEWPNVDTMWIDYEKGCLIRKRIYSFGQDKPLRSEISNRDFREVIPGLVLPFEQSVEKYADIRSEDEEVWGKVANTSEYKIIKCEIGENVDDLFTFNLPAGTSVDDFVHDASYTVRSQGGDPFDASLREAQQVVETNKGNAWKTIIGINAIIAIVVVVLFFLRRSKRTALLVAFVSLSYSIDVMGENKLPFENREISSTSLSPKSDYKVNSAESWNWLPDWRSQGDCGPNSLYVLLRLSGKEVSLNEIKKLCPHDLENGSSMNDLKATAEKFGVTIEGRFVTPSELKQFRSPVIVHGKTKTTGKVGHYVVLVGYDEGTRRFGIIDPAYESFAWYGEDSLLSTMSGYVLAETQKVNSPEIVSSVALIGTTWLIVYYVLSKFRASNPAKG